MRISGRRVLYGTALRIAAFAGHKAVMEQLLDHGTDKNLVDIHGRNTLPLAQASVPHNSEGIHLLLHSRYAGSFCLMIWPRTHAARSALRTVIVLKVQRGCCAMHVNAVSLREIIF